MRTTRASMGMMICQSEMRGLQKQVGRVQKMTVIRGHYGNFGSNAAAEVRIEPAPAPTPPMPASDAVLLIASSLAFFLIWFYVAGAASTDDGLIACIGHDLRHLGRWLFGWRRRG